MDIEKDVFGAAVFYFNEKKAQKSISVESNITEAEKIDTSYLFRSYSQMPKLEQIGLNLCKGKILDIGACAGSHTLYLQKKGLDVSALEISPRCCEVMKKRGVKKVFNADFFQFNHEKFDTLLLLMNGIGIAANLRKLQTFLDHCKTLLNPGGQILFDSSDIRYMYEDEDGDFDHDDSEGYYGELTYEIGYGKIKSDPFGWLFIDPNTMETMAQNQGFSFTLIQEGEHYDYLGKLEV